jgi:putative ABC transport system permease protein
MLRTALAGIRYRKARLALSSLAIVAAVAFLAGTLILSASVKQAFFTGFAAGARNVSAVVAAQRSGNPPGQFGGQTVPPSALARVRAVPGVAAADGRLTGAAPLIGSTGRVIGNGFGINVASDPALNGFTVVSGHLPADPGQVDVDQATAADEHFRLGQAIRVVSHSGTIQAFRLAGTIDLGVDPQFGNSSVTAFTTAAAVRVTGQARYGLIAARATPGVSPAALAARLRSAPALSRDRVLTGARLATEEADSAVQVAQQLTTGILVFALIALVVACIVVGNTFSILTAQRSREFALLRCVGASRRQVFASMLAESAVTGLAGSGVGVLAGTGVSWGLERVLAGFGAHSTPSAVLVPLSAVLISVGTGLAVTVAAAVLPARAATRVAPVAALGGPAGPAASPRAGRARVAVAIVAAAAGILLTYAGVRQASGNSASGFAVIAAGGCVCFAALFALGPVITSPALAALGWLPGRLAGVTVRLATANARRNPHRVAATTAALTIGITLMTVFTVVISSVRASTDAALEGHFPFDYLVQASQGQQSIPPPVVRALTAAPELGLVAPFYLRAASVDGARTPVGAYGHSALGIAIRPAMVSGSLAAVRAGTAAVDSSQLRSLGIRMGGTLLVRTPDAGLERLRVVAVYDAAVYRSPLPGVLISAGDYVRGFRPAGPGQVVIDAAPDVSAAASRAAVTAAAASDPLLGIDTLADYKASLNSRIDDVLVLFGALLGLAILIALLGIANTLTLSVIERTRESALIRALGLTRGQLRCMLLAEALLMTALAVGLGFGLGITFGLIMTDALGASAGGREVTSIPYAQIALYAAISACAAQLAAVLPARRAARTAVVASLAEA